MIRTIADVLQRWGFSRGGWLDNRRGEWWLLAQLLLIALDVLLPSWPARWAWPPFLLPWLPLVGLGLLGGGLVLALLAFMQLGESLTPLPEPMPAVPLKQQGLYGFCRHPLYLAVLICSSGMALIRAGLLHPLLLLALAMLLVGKARREERSLMALHPDFEEYRQRTAAIVPWLPGLDWR